MTRKEFLQTAAGVAAVTAMPGAGAAAAATAKKGPKRGVSLFSYTMEFQHRKNLEDLLEHVADLGAPGQGYKMGVEILHGHVPGYPNPSTAWVDNWHKLIAKYNLEPVQFGSWIDSNRYFGRETTAKEELQSMLQDIELASLLGFQRIRSRYAHAPDENGRPALNPGGGAMRGRAGMLGPPPGGGPPPAEPGGKGPMWSYMNDPHLKSTWKEVIKAALPTAEKRNVRIVEESQYAIKAPQVGEMIEFMEKEKAFPWFAINPDFVKFATMRMGGRTSEPGSKPEELKPILKYVGCIHAKTGDISRDCESEDTPYPELVKIIKDSGWDGYLITEYQGSKMFEGQSIHQVRRAQVQLRRLLGEV
ncbi:MAG: hypothetical protein IT169_05965 [Bryobacterales bacterium]|nr:hypothetical protein [Bryobacterales bacterium]